MGWFGKRNLSAETQSHEERGENLNAVYRCVLLHKLALFLSVFQLFLEVCIWAVFPSALFWFWGCFLGFVVDCCFGFSLNWVINRVSVVWEQSHCMCGDQWNTNWITGALNYRALKVFSFPMIKAVVWIWTERKRFFFLMLNGELREYKEGE